MLAVHMANDYAVVTASGEFDMANAPALQHRLTEVIDSGARHLLLDLADVTFLDAATLRVLVSVRNRLIALNGELILLRVSEPAMLPLRITALDEVFTIRATLAEALTTLHGTQRRTEPPGLSDRP